MGTKERFLYDWRLKKKFDISYLMIATFFLGLAFELKIHKSCYLRKITKYVKVTGLKNNKNLL